MADNTQLDLGSGGDLISTDELAGSVKVQRVKIQTGTDGNAADVNSGNPLPVSDAGASLTVDNPALSVTGNGTAAGAQRVTIASDSTGNIAVAADTELPAAGALGDDMANPTTPLVGSCLMIFDGAGNNWDRALGTNGRQAVQGSEGVDAAIGFNPIAVAGRASTAAVAPVSADGDVQIPWLSRRGAVHVAVKDDDGDSCMDDTNNSLRVSIVSGAGSGGTSMTDDAAFTVGVSGITPAGGIFTSGRDTVNDGDGGAFAMTAQRALYATLETPNGDSVMNETTNAVQVHIAATDIPLGGTAMLDDAGFTVGTTQVTPAAGIYRTTRDLVDDGDAGALAMNQRRGLFVTLENSNGTERGTTASPLPVALYDTAGDSCMDNANDAIRVNVVAGGAAGGGISQADDSSFTAGATPLTPVGGLYLATRDLVDDSDAGAFAMTQRRALYVTLETLSGDSVLDDTDDTVRAKLIGTATVDHFGGSVTDGITADEDTAQDTNAIVAGVYSFDISGTWSATLQFEGTMDLSTWVPLPVYPVGLPTPVTSTTANGQWQVQGGAWGRVRVRASDYTSGTAVVKISRSASTWTPPAGGTQGLAAHDAPVSGYPLLLGAFASSSAPSSVSADGDAVRLWADGNGRLHTRVFTSTSEPLVTRLIDGAGDSVADDANNAIRVNVVAGGAGGGDVQGVDAHDAALTADPLTIGGYASTAVPTSVSTDGDAVRAWFYRNGAQAVSIVDSGGATALRSEDAGHVSGHTGTPILVVRRDTASSAVDANGDYAMLGVSSDGRLWASATIDAALPAGTNNIGDVDVLSVVPGTGATALGKAEDAAAGSGDTGVAVLAVRRDTPDSGVGADGDYAMLSVDSTGALRVTGGDGSVQGVDASDAAVTADPVFMGARASTAIPTAVSADGDAVGLWATRSGALQVGIRDDAGDSCMDGTNNALRVNIVAGSSAGVQFAEDAAHTTGDQGTVALAVRRDTAAVGSGTDGDYSTLNVNASGRLYTSTTIDAALPAGTNNIGDVDVVTLPGVAGTAAHDAAVSGNPVLIGFEARTSNGTAVSNGDAVRPMADTLGKQVVLSGAPHELDVQGDITLTNTTAADIVAAQGSGVRIVITNLVITNNHATVGTKVEIRDGTTVLMQVACAAAGGGVALANPRGILKSTANTAITGRCVTTGADVDIFASGYTITNG